jgi:hypothetical protein
MASHLTYATIQTADWLKVDFSQIEENSPDTVRRSIDLSQFVVKYEIEPEFIRSGLVVPDAVMNHEDALLLMDTLAWSEAPPPP